MFYNAQKITQKWSEAIILVQSRTGGYPINQNVGLEPVNPSFPIKAKERRGTTHKSACVDRFPPTLQADFSLTHLRQVASRGNEVVSEYGSLNMAIRAIQEEKMIDQSYLVDLASKHLHVNPALMGDITELHRLGAIPKFRGRAPDTFRVRGIPRNPSEQLSMLNKLRTYVAAGEMYVCFTSSVSSFPYASYISPKSLMTFLCAHIEFVRRLRPSAEGHRL